MLDIQVGSAPARAVNNEAERSRDAAGPTEGERSPAALRVQRFGPVSLVTSVMAHVAIMLGALIHWGSPQPLAATPPPSVTVDIVSAKDVPQLQIPELPPVQPLPREAPKPEHSAQEPAGQQPPKQNPPPARQELSKQEKPDRTAAAPQREPTAFGIDTGDANKTIGPGWMEQALNAPMTTPKVDLDSSPSNIKAKLPADTVAQFKARLDKCWVAPTSVANTAGAKVVMRIALRPDGRLAAPPDDVALPVSSVALGLALKKSAIRALQQCQPYNFLPANKYKEWRILDLSFTPDGLLGG